MDQYSTDIERTNAILKDMLLTAYEMQWGNVLPKETNIMVSTLKGNQCVAWYAGVHKGVDGRETGEFVVAGNQCYAGNEKNVYFWLNVAIAQQYSELGMVVPANPKDPKHIGSRGSTAASMYYNRSFKTVGDAHGIIVRYKGKSKGYKPVGLVSEALDIVDKKGWFFTSQRTKSMRNNKDGTGSSNRFKGECPICGETDSSARVIEANIRPVVCRKCLTEYVSRLLSHGPVIISGLEQFESIIDPYTYVYSHRGT